MKHQGEAAPPKVSNFTEMDSKESRWDEIPKNSKQLQKCLTKSKRTGVNSAMNSKCR